MSLSAWLRGMLVFSGTLPWIFAYFNLRALWLINMYHTLCHQWVERTLHFGTYPMLICSRCAGLYLGIAIGALFPLTGAFLEHARTALAFAFGVTILDVVTQDLHLHAPNHAVRLATGLAMGFVASAFMLGAILKGERAKQKPSSLVT
jgi:uncharacterized membrane protein